MDPANSTSWPPTDDVAHYAPRRLTTASRVAVFLFGLLIYALFLATMLYAVGFVGNIVVPKSIDGGMAAPLGEAVLVDLALVTLFGIQHSGMARRGFKRAWMRLVPPPLERSSYVLLSSAALALLFWQWRPIEAPLWTLDGPAALGMRILFWAGWSVAVASTFLIDHADLFGLRQVTLHLRGRPYAPVLMKERGVYRQVRHPLMLGFLVAFWATPVMTAGHALFAGAMTVYIRVGIGFEERDLVRAHGSAYERYRQAVPMLLPWRRRPRVP